MCAKNNCPFCEQDVITIVSSIPPALKGLQAECDNCGARDPIYETEEEAIIGFEEGINVINGRIRKK